MKDKKIARLRERIDDVDQQLLELIKKRLDLAEQIGEVKKENKINIIDSSREKDLFVALEKKCSELKLDADIVSNIWHQILKASYRSQE